MPLFRYKGKTKYVDDDPYLLAHEKVSAPESTLFQPTILLYNGSTTYPGSTKSNETCSNGYHFTNGDAPANCYGNVAQTLITTEAIITKTDITGNGHMSHAANPNGSSCSSDTSSDSDYSYHKSETVLQNGNGHCKQNGTRQIDEQRDQNSEQRNGHCRQSGSAFQTHTVILYKPPDTDCTDKGNKVNMLHYNEIVGCDLLPTTNHEPKKQPCRNVSAAHVVRFVENQSNGIVEAPPPKVPPKPVSGILSHSEPTENHQTDIGRCHALNYTEMNGSVLLNAEHNMKTYRVPPKVPPKPVNGSLSTSTVLPSAKSQELFCHTLKYYELKSAVLFSAEENIGDRFISNAPDSVLCHFNANVARVERNVPITCSLPIQHHASAEEFRAIDCHIVPSVTKCDMKTETTFAVNGHTTTQTHVMCGYNDNALEESRNIVTQSNSNIATHANGNVQTLNDVTCGVSGHGHVTGLPPACRKPETRSFSRSYLLTNEQHKKISLANNNCCAAPAPADSPKLSARGKFRALSEHALNLNSSSTKLFSLEGKRQMSNGNCNSSGVSSSDQLQQSTTAESRRSRGSLKALLTWNKNMKGKRSSSVSCSRSFGMDTVVQAQRLQLNGLRETPLSAALEPIHDFEQAINRISTTMKNQPPTEVQQKVPLCLDNGHVNVHIKLVNLTANDPSNSVSDSQDSLRHPNPTTIQVQSTAPKCRTVAPAAVSMSTGATPQKKWPPTIFPDYVYDDMLQDSVLTCEKLQLSLDSYITKVVRTNHMPEPAINKEEITSS